MVEGVVLPSNVPRITVVTGETGPRECTSKTEVYLRHTLNALSASETSVKGGPSRRGKSENLGFIPISRESAREDLPGPYRSVLAPRGRRCPYGREITGLLGCPSGVLVSYFTGVSRSQCKVRILVPVGYSSVGASEN